jgi:hypothetical protein
MSTKFDVFSMEKLNRMLLKKFSIYLIGLGKKKISV